VEICSCSGHTGGAALVESDDAIGIIDIQSGSNASYSVCEIFGHAQVKERGDHEGAICYVECRPIGNENGVIVVALSDPQRAYVATKGSIHQVVGNTDTGVCAKFSELDVISAGGRNAADPIGVVGPVGVRAAGAVPDDGGGVNARRQR